MKLIKLVLVAMLLFVSPFAFAAKASKVQEINTGPVWQGNLIACWVSNTTDASIYVDITLYYSTIQSNESVLFEAIEIEPNSVLRRDRLGSNRGGYCKFTWEGGVGEVRGTACSFYSDATTDQFLGCSDAY